MEIPDAMVDGRIWVSGAKWADPVERNFKSRVRKFLGAPTIPTNWAQEAKQSIRKKFNLQSIFPEYDAALGDVIDIS